MNRNRRRALAQRLAEHLLQSRGYPHVGARLLHGDARLASSVTSCHQRHSDTFVDGCRVHTRIHLVPAHLQGLQLLLAIHERCVGDPGSQPQRCVTDRARIRWPPRRLDGRGSRRYRSSRLAARGGRLCRSRRLDARTRRRNRPRRLGARARCWHRSRRLAARGGRLCRSRRLDAVSGWNPRELAHRRVGEPAIGESALSSSSALLWR